MAQQTYDPRNPQPGVYYDQPIRGRSVDAPPRDYSNEPFDPLGAAKGALAKLKGLMPQRAPAPPEPAGPPPMAPDAPAWTKQVNQPGTPNVPYLDDSDTVTNDDPNQNIRMQLAGIDPKTTPSVLQGLRSAGGMDESKLMVLNDKLRDDEALNLSNGYSQASLLPGDRANYGFSTGANPEHIRQLSSDLAPLDQYRGQKLDYAQKQYEAGLGGFKSPQEAAAFGQSLEARKATAPTDVAKIQAQGNVDVQKLKDAGYEDFFIKMMTANAAGMPPGLSIRGPNGIGLTAAPVSPGASAAAGKSVEQLTKELFALENPTRVGPVPMVNPWQDTQRLIAAKRAEIAAAQARVTGQPAPTQQEDPRRAEATRLLNEAGMPVTEANINHVMQQLH